MLEDFFSPAIFIALQSPNWDLLEEVKNSEVSIIRWIRLFCWIVHVVSDSCNEVLHGKMAFHCLCS